MSLTAIRSRCARPLHWAPVALLALAALLSGCSKSNPAAPALPGPAKFLVFTSDRTQPPGRTRNFYLTFDTGAYAQLPASDTVVVRRPSIRSDGALIAFEEGPASGYTFPSRVVLYGVSSGTRTLDPHVNIAGVNETDPYLSLDGTKLLFVRDTLGTKQLRLYDLTTGSLIPLPGLAGAPGTNDWAPACDALAHRIAFTSDRNGNLDVFLYQLPTTSLIDIPGVTSPSVDQEPCVSGNGRFLAWSSDRTPSAGGFDILVMDINSQTFADFPSNSSANEAQPSLSVDGTYVTFASDRPNGSGGIDLWNLNRATSTTWQVTNESSAATEALPVLVWP